MIPSVQRSTAEEPLQNRPILTKEGEDLIWIFKEYNPSIKNRYNCIQLLINNDKKFLKEISDLKISRNNQKDDGARDAIQKILNKELQVERLLPKEFDVKQTAFYLQYFGILSDENVNHFEDMLKSHNPDFSKACQTYFSTGNLQEFSEYIIMHQDKNFKEDIQSTKTIVFAQDDTIGKKTKKLLEYLLKTLSTTEISVLKKVVHILKKIINDGDEILKKIVEEKCESNTLDIEKSIPEIRNHIQTRGAKWKGPNIEGQDDNGLETMSNSSFEYSENERKNEEAVRRKAMRRIKNTANFEGVNQFDSKYVAVCEEIYQQNEDAGDYEENIDLYYRLNFEGR